METMKTIASRKSCRSYTGEQITEEELNLILDAANAAPIGMGKYDEVKLTVIQDSELLGKLDAEGAKFFGNPDLRPTYGAPTVILVSAKTAEGKQNPVSYCNAACIIENMALAATDLGIGNVYLLGSIVALSLNPQLFAQFKIPQGFFPASAIALGKTDIPIEERPLTATRIATEYVR